MRFDRNFYDFVEEHYKAKPDETCLIGEGDIKYSRKWLHDESGRYANTLVELGCKQGDRVAAQIEKTPQGLALFLGCLRAGICFMPLNTAYKSSELAYLLSDGAPKIFVSQSLNIPEGLPSDSLVMSLNEKGQGTIQTLAASASPEFTTVKCNKDTLGCLIYTSGTTGKPKGAMLGHGAIGYTGVGLGEYWGLSEADTLLHMLPMFHAHGLLISSNVALAAGSKMIFKQKFDQDDAINNLPKSTVFMGVPTFYHRLLADPRLTPELCKSMRVFTCGSAPLSAEIHREFEDRTGHKIIERYGATETMILCSNPLNGDRRPGSVGFPLPGVDLRIANEADEKLEDGEIGMIQVKGLGMFDGYWKMPEQTKKEFTNDGWFRTGDLGSISKDGYVSITGRSKDLVISGGYNVYPAEVETVINELGSVRESAIVGTPHPDFGEAVVAFVIPSNNSVPPKSEEIIQWVKDKLANYKVPKQVVIVDDLPRNAMGKVLKNQLRESLLTKA